MKKTILTTLLAIIAFVGFAQNNGALKFLGIPIDGTKAQFGARLVNKGFTYISARDYYKGEFNGSKVDVFLHTNHNKVDRVYVAFPSVSEENIRSEYNHLLDQFDRNAKYVDLSFNETIPEKEDISYQITVHNKRYQASFCYYDPNRDPFEFFNALIDEISELLTEEQYLALKEYAKKNKGSEFDLDELERKLLEEMNRLGVGQNMSDSSDVENRVVGKFLNGLEAVADGSVWFMIHESYGKYYIGLYYDNLHNQAHGEDL